MIGLIKKLYFSRKILNVSTDNPDHRDWVHKSKINKLDLPENFSRRKTTVPVKNQGKIGSCVGHSGRVVCGSANIFQSEEPSPMWIYKTAKKYDPWEGEDYSGTSIRGAANGLIKQGCCFESFWPYEDTEDSTPKEGAALDASYKKISSYKTIPCDDINEIKAVLMDRPMWYAYMVHQNFFSLGFSGIIDTDKYLASAKAGGHAVCLIGWKYIDNKLYWEFQNSWGPYFGNRGYFFMEHRLFRSVIINSIGPYYLEFKDGYFNPGPDPDPVDPEPDPDPVDPEPDPDPVDPKPEPDPVDPEPEPDPVDPKPEPRDPWIKRNLAWVVCGTFIIVAIIFYITSLIQSKTEVYVPYIDEQGNVNWDEKYEYEKQVK